MPHASRLCVLAGIIIIIIIITTTACRTTPATQAPAPSETVLIKAVNLRCPNGGDPVPGGMLVDPELARTHKGQTVGFCSPTCLPAWDKMSDAQKDAALARAATAAPQTAQPVSE